MQKLIQLVTELKAPKNQYNSFGKYNYRNIEDIMEAVKPLLHKYGLKLTFVDYSKTVMLDGVENTVIYSTAIIKDSNNMVLDKGTGMAGVERRKGMDLAQTFGASTSYARKYAAGALLNLDDTKDADSMPKPKEVAKQALQPNTEAFLKAVQFIRDGGTMDDIRKKYSVSSDTAKLIAQKLSK